MHITHIPRTQDGEGRENSGRMRENESVNTYHIKRERRTMHACMPKATGQKSKRRTKEEVVVFPILYHT